MARREGMVGVFEQAVSERIELNLRNGNEGPFLQLPQSSLVPHEARVSAERRRGFCSGVDEKSEQPDAGAFRLLYEARSGPFLGDESQDLGQELLVDLRHEIRVDLDDGTQAGICRRATSASRLVRHQPAVRYWRSANRSRRTSRRNRCRRPWVPLR